MTPAIDAVPSGSQDRLSFDERLQASRRIDWRFLLPDPDLGRVVYVGPDRSTLVEALGLFSQSVTEIGSGHTDSQRYDTVVLHNQNIKNLRIMARLVKPGGSLYLEAYGLLGPMKQGGWLSRLRHPNYLMASLESLGFGDNQLHWHWPNSNNAP